MIIDVIGDIHGYADKLVGLLKQLGYVHNGQYFVPPEGHRALFIGDLMDRGPQQVATLEIVFAMLDADVADAVMGNHEYNALAFATPDPDVLWRVSALARCGAYPSTRGVFGRGAFWLGGASVLA